MAFGSLPHLAWALKRPLFGLRNQFHQVTSCQCFAPFVFPNSNNLHDVGREHACLRDAVCRSLTDAAHRTARGASISPQGVLTAPIFLEALIPLHTPQHTLAKLLMPGGAQGGRTGVKQNPAHAPKESWPQEAHRKDPSLKISEQIPS